MLTPNNALSLLEEFQAEQKTFPDDFKRAAVCMVLEKTDQGLSLLMIKRSEYEGDPWSGQMAFPGGRVEPEDANPLAGALRECVEEVGVSLSDSARLLCEVSQKRATMRSRRIDMVVSAFVFFAEKKLQCMPNYEVAKTVSIPLELFLNDDNRQSFEMTYEGKQIQLPCYYFGEDKVWGLSLRFIDDLVAVIRSKDQ